MKKVGLTGNIGSGKTTVCKIFETIEVPVFYADLVGQALLKEPDVAGIIAQQFGKAVLDSDAGVNRAALASIVFKDKESLRRLNQIIHPLVWEKFAQWASALGDFHYVIQEAAILFETGFNKNFDKVIVVSAPESLRIQRVMERDNVSESDVLARGANQFPQTLLEEKADFIIINDGKTAVLPQVLEIDARLRNCTN